MIRRLAERFSRDRVLRRRLPRRFDRAPIFVSPDSALSYWFASLQSLGGDLFDFAEHFLSPGDVAWDVGANVGLFTFAAAQVTGPEGMVVAVEPDNFCVSLLRKTTSIPFPERAKIEVIPVAMNDAVDLLDFHIAGRGRSSSHLANSEGNSQAGGVRRRVQVPAVTMDWLLERRPAPSVVKIDVEGAETNVLKGAGKLLSETRPVLLVEVGRSRSADVTGCLQGHAYRMFDWETRTGNEVEGAPFSTLALPEERAPAWLEGQLGR